MKKLITLMLLLFALIGFGACEQVNPTANTVSGTDVQVTDGDPAAEADEDEDDDDDDEDN